MPPPSQNPALHLQILPSAFFVVQAEGEGLPASVLAELAKAKSSFLSVTRTADEVSIVGESYAGMPEVYQTQATWSCIKIRGPMEHSLTGVMAAFTAPLKGAKVPIFALSTWNTDYVLVPTEKLGSAVETLTVDGWEFEAGPARE